MVDALASGVSVHYDEADRLTHRTVKGETAEQWQYDERGWLTDISHISEGHRVAVQRHKPFYPDDLQRDATMPHHC
ncbi:RHS repeat protein [Escherichia coli]|uniref:RHS repeat protein n=1 Tax=Escherichia coli TaxID=562 RepID=UPI001626844A|nr:RHS repeat protein [Escherichia coli]